MIYTDELALGLSEKREGEKTLDMDVFRHMKEDALDSRGCLGWSRMKGSARE